MESVNIKIVVVGATGVGKSTLIHRFVGKGYRQKRNENLREITVGNKTVRIWIREKCEEPQLLMVPRLRVEPRIGEEPRLVVERRSMDEVLLSRANAMFVYDITNEQSFPDICSGIETCLREYPHKKMLIVGNKSDLEDQREVNVNEVKTFAQEKNVTHIECDSKEGINVELAFYKLVGDVLKDIDKDLAIEFRMMARNLSANLYNDAYRQALKDGKAKNKRIPVMIVGQDRAGKTSLMKHLFGVPFDSEEPSTVGIELEVVELTEQNSEEPWQKKLEKQLMVRQEEAKDQILRQVAEMATKAPAKPDEEYRDHGLPESKSHREEYPKTVNHSKESVSLSSDDVEKVASLTEATVDVEASSGIRVFVHDLSGQSIFYETHHHFLKLHCPYVVVHDLTKPLDEPAHPRFKSKLTGNEVDLQNPFLVTNLDYLLMWLAALDNLGGCEKEELTSFALPPVLIALANSDQFEGDAEAVKQRIKEVVRKRTTGNVHVEPFIINNASPERSGVVIRNLRKKLFELCKEILDKQPEFPINWLNLEVAFGQILSEKRNYVSIEEARNVARKCNVKRFDEAVAFLHRQGSIVCPTGSNHVVLNPPFLMNLFTDIITVPEEEQAIDVPHFQKLREHGILMHKFLLNRDHGELLKELMTRFNLICPCKHERESAYLVPSIAPIMAKGKAIEGILSDSPIAALYIAFRGSHLPPGVFVRVLVMLMNRCRGELSGQQPKLYCNYCLVSFIFHEGKFDVYFMKLAEKIKIGVVPRREVPPKCQGLFLCHLRKVINCCLEAIKSDESLSYHTMIPDFVVKCSACFGKYEECFRHKKYQCQYDECRHFWSLEELKPCSDDPICIHSDDVKRREFCLDRVKPWLTTEPSSMSATVPLSDADVKSNSEDPGLRKEPSSMSATVPLYDADVESNSEGLGLRKESFSMSPTVALSDANVKSNSECSELRKGAECNNPPTIKQKEFKPHKIEWGKVNQQFHVLLITVNDEEFNAATRILSFPKRTVTGKRLGPFYFGKIGKNIVALVRSAPGAIGKAAVQATCQDAIEELSPKVIVLLGVCFGMSKDKQSLGDLLVATRTAFYSQGRINKDGSVYSRSPQPECEARLQRAFQDGKVNWTAPGDGEINPKVHFGLVLSGPQLIDNEEWKEEIRKAFPEAIGGEMEAEGVYSLCDRHKIPWILCKSICDWADGSKNENWQHYAAAVSASFVEHVLEQTYLPECHESPNWILGFLQRIWSSIRGERAEECNLKPELQPGEIAEIARRIPHKWTELAYQTNQFETYEVENIQRSHPNGDEKSRALTMLTEYKAKGGTRNQLAEALEKVGMSTVSQEVLRGDYLSTCNK